MLFRSYRWSSLRSSYTAEANVDRAQTYTMGGWYAPGWDWDPYFSCYTFIPGDGIFYSPFGWGFYSPFFVGWAPIGYYGRYYHHFGPDWHRWGGSDHYIAHYDHGSYRGPGGYYGHSGLFHGAHGGPHSDMGHGGGEHYGGGGFHGGGGVSWWWGRRSSLKPEPSESHSGTLKRPAFFVPSVRTMLKTPTVTAHAAASSL